MTGIVGVIVNPVAGKDIRRLVSGASHTSDTTKMGIVRRVVAAAAESGAERIVLADDPHRLARRAVDRLDLPDGVTVELLDVPVTGRRDDSVAAATTMWKLDASVVVVLGGDGTCRDVATGWPDAPMIAISTGTNNVYPSHLDGTSAGVAAGLIAGGLVPVEAVSYVSKRIVVRLTGPDVLDRADDIALVDLALIDTAFVGARAVHDPHTIRAVVAAIASPESTGLSSIAGRLHPVDRDRAGGVYVRLTVDGNEPTVRQVRVPLSPGSFDTIDIAEVRPLHDGEPITIHGPGVLAFDGERDLPIGRDTLATVTVDHSGPRLVDVTKTLHHAVANHAFDAERITSDVN